ncbi:MAG: hypothetical protein ACI9UA_001411 [Pseudoalteromonas tetraodonis]
MDEHGSRIVLNWESSLPGNPFFLNSPGVVRVLGHYEVFDHVPQLAVHQARQRHQDELEYVHRAIPALF